MRRRNLDVMLAGLIAVLVCTISTPADTRAQVAPEEPLAYAPLSFGLRAGFDVTGMTGDALTRAQPGTSLSGGIFMTYRPYRPFAIQPEVLYARRTAAASGSALHPLAANLRYRFGSVQVPLLLKWYAPAAGTSEPHLFAGPFAGILTSAEVEDGNQTVDQAAFEEEVRSVNYGAVVGGGLVHHAAGRRLTLDARYWLGLTNLFDSAADVADVRSRRFSLSVGVGL